MSSKKVTTRKDFECPILGNARDFPNNKLPNYEDVLLCCFQVRYEMSLYTNNKKVSFSEVANTVATKIMNLYSKASIPSVTKERIVQLINKYHDKYYKIRKSYHRDINKADFKKKIDDFKRDSALLFDMAACKCPIVVNCTCKKTKLSECKCTISINCHCEKANKIPAIELRFIYLQRRYGLGKIGSLDLEETRKLAKRLDRKTKNIEPQPSTSRGIIKESDENVQFIKVEKDSDSDDEDDLDLYDPPVRHQVIKNKKPWQMRINLKTTSLASDRFGVSDRATAAIASSVLQDFGIINDTDTSQVIDKNKIRRGKTQNRNFLQCQSIEEALHGLYFDGRKDETIVIKEINSKRFRKTEKEDHYSLIQEPGSKYIGHVSPTSGLSKDIASSIVAYLAKQGISLEELDVIGSDGTVINTGWKKGVIHQIELHVGRPVQWAICLLHFNELPFRHLFHHLDGVTTGPKSFSGPIGKKLVGCEKLPPVQFEPVDCPIPIIDRKVLSKDQMYLLDISVAINTGTISEDLAARDPGPLSHSRWLTAANRVLRLYVSMEIPSEEVKQLIHFILKCYMPLWFKIKTSKKFTDGPKIVFETIRTSRYLSQNLLQVIDPVIERNAFFAHPENLLLAMIVDESRYIRELGLRRIWKARSLMKGKPIRNFNTPRINFVATDYTDMICWATCKLSPPPLLRRITDEEIKQLIHSGTPLAPDFNDFPCHTQAVERCVKLVSEASKKVCGVDARDGLIRTTLLSRSIMPEFSTKSDFKVQTI